ncbi:MAG: hypothetical protein DMF03_10015 [Verrucomicrobia bacterium]|nr:MAG: hypothetical protein DMF03_10015 [Verrucomicrobiota bacterium]
MKGFTSLVLGIFGTLAFSWIGLAYIPNLQIGHLDPQMEEDGSDAYPVPKSGMAERGRRVYVANGCFYCHSEQVRADYAGADIDRKWGDRRSAPRDYIFDRPALLGRLRMGPDLSNIGKRAPAEAEAAASPAANASASPAPAGSPAPATANPVTAASTPASSAAQSPAASPASAAANPAASPAQSPMAAASPGASPGVTAANSPSGTPALYSTAWHYQHLYAPRSLNIDSNMPAYRFLFDKRHIGGEPAADALKLRGNDAPTEGYEIIPNYDAKCLVAYLMSLDQSHPLKEVKSMAAPPSPPAPGKAPQ